MVSVLITRCASDIHGFEIASLYHGNGQSARSRQVTEGKHQIPEVHIILKDNTKHIELYLDDILPMFVCKYLLPGIASLIAHASQSGNSVQSLFPGGVINRHKPNC